ncbi:hypothetical protein [Glaciecola sp. 1036]|uniref:hypothetical protein n=1 Tax=Alteromonadaceae TaxID=72275 RepID=UPI003D006649
MKFVAVIFFSLLTISSSLATEDLVIHTTPVNPKHKDLHEIIIKAYESLGVPVVYTSLPYTRGLVSANYGVIDAVDLRFESHVTSYPNLVKVEYPVYTGATYLVVDNETCAKCTKESVGSVASVSGYQYSSFFKTDVFAHLARQEFAEHKMLFRFFDRQRVQAMVVGDIFLPEKYLNNERYSLYKLGTHKVFHYLHQKHQGLAIRLERSFRRLDHNAVNSSNNQMAEQREKSYSGASVSIAPGAAAN